MTATLGELIRLARNVAELSQAQLADRLGVNERTVDGWERGVSRPRRASLNELCSVLGLKLEHALAAGDYEQKMVVPSQNRLLNLPFENLSADAFEAFCRDLLQMRYPGRTAVRNGSSGHKQYGVDVYVEGGGERIGVQCKRHQRFGPSNIQKAVDEVLPDAQLTSGIIALSRPAATPAARLEMARHTGWALWDGETISGLVRGLQPPDKLALVETYFPELRESFLGIPEPSPWLEAERYHNAPAGSFGIDHSFALAGRGDELRKLSDLAAQHHDLVLVVGRGGIGKSRLLREFANSDVGRAVRFVARGLIAPDAFELLPLGAPVIVIDDASDAERDVAALTEGIRRARPDATIVLATRPRGLPKLLASLELPGPLADDVTVTVGDLSIEDAESLAQEALGDTSTDEQIKTLARLGYDCPFLIVTGARLLRAGRLTDADLASQVILRREILARFTDVILRGANADARTAVLEALAAIQPVPLDHPDFMDCLAAITGQSQAALLEIIDELEDLGLVLRRAHTVRVVPDLLGDATLERALVSQAGLDKQFAQQLAEHARGSALAHAINNVSIIDWHRRAEGTSDLADVLWSALAIHARGLSNSARIALGEEVAAVGAIYPVRALQFADELLLNPSDDELDKSSRLWGVERSITHDDVARSLSSLIANAGHRIEVLPNALRRLLDIGLEDDRRENSHPDHAFRLARELGELHPQRTVAFATRYVETVGEILNHDEYPKHSAQIVSLLGPALADEITVTEFDGHRLSISRGSVSLKAVATLRSKAIAIAVENLTHDRPRARAALDILEKALQTGARTDPVTEEFAGVVEVLRAIISDPDKPAGLRLSAYRALGWHASYGEGPRRELVRDVRRELYVDDEFRFVWLIRPGWAFDDEDIDDDDGDVDLTMSRYERSRRRAERIEAELAERWCKLYSPVGLLRVIERLLDQEHSYSDGQVLPDKLLVRFFRLVPETARAVVLKGADGPVGWILVRVALVVLIEQADVVGEQAALQLVEAGPRAARTVASAVMSIPSPSSRVRVGIVRALLTTDDPETYAILLNAASWLDPEDRELALEILNSVPVEEQPGLAEAALRVVDGRAVPWQAFSTAERQRFLKRLESVPQLPGYELGTLLNQEIAVDPLVAIGFLQRRVERYLSGSHSVVKYDPLPHPMGLDFTSTDQRPVLIKGVVQWILADDSGRRSYFGRRIIDSLAAGYDEEIQAAMMDLIRSGDEEKILIVRSLLHDTPRDFLLRASTFVIQAITVASQMGPELRIQVLAGLHGSAEYGSFSRAVGEDDPLDVALRDGATTIAARFSESSPVRRFYMEVAERAARRIEEERRDDRNLRDPRPWG